jgi:uncharacterized SAM-binding protein YcdF (DUF218 family)
VLSKEVATALLVPPIPLVFVALVGLLIERRHRRIGRFLQWFGVLGLLVLAMPVVGGFLLLTLEENLPLSPPPGQPPQAIVVLGGDTLLGGSQIPIVHLGPLSLERVRAAAQLYRRTGLPVLISGGRLRASEPPVGAMMADSLVHDFQVPVQWVERESRDTWENAHLSAAILQGQGIKSVYVVTQAWHMHRAIAAFAGSGITVTAAPTRLDRAPSMWFAIDFVPEVGGWRQSYLALHEWIGLVWYSLRALN